MKYKHSNLFLFLSFLCSFSSLIYFVFFVESLQANDNSLLLYASNFITSIIFVAILLILNRMSLKISDLDKRVEELEKNNSKKEK